MSIIWFNNEMSCCCKLLTKGGVGTALAVGAEGRLQQVTCPWVVHHLYPVALILWPQLAKSVGYLGVHLLVVVRLQDQDMSRTLPDLQCRRVETGC